MKNIVWAIDPLASDTQVFADQYRSIAFLSGLLGAKVYPVYVLAPSSLALPSSFARSQMSQFEQYAKSALNERFGEHKAFEGLQSAQVIVQPKRSHTLSSEALLGFASKLEAPLVVMSRSNKSTMERLFLGSFVEVMVDKTQSPLMVLNESPLGALDRVVVPVEFTEECERRLPDIVQTAGTLKASVVFMHVVEEFVNYAFATFDAAVNVNELSHQALEDGERTLETWASRFEPKPMTLIEQRPGALSTAIVSLCDKADADAVFLYRGRAHGSRLCKRVLREANKPTLVFP